MRTVCGRIACSACGASRACRVVGVMRVRWRVYSCAQSEVCVSSMCASRALCALCVPKFTQKLYAVVVGGPAAHPASPNACAASNCDVTVASLAPRCRSAAAAPARCVPASSPPWFVLSCVAAGWGSACAGLPSFASAGQNAVRWPGRPCPCRPCPCRLCLCLCRRRPCRRPCRGRRRLCRRRLCRRPCLSGRQHHPSVP